jgi:hypothetical protein
MLSNPSNNQSYVLNVTIDAETKMVAWDRHVDVYSHRNSHLKSDQAVKELIRASTSDEDDVFTVSAF